MKDRKKKVENDPNNVNVGQDTGVGTVNKIRIRLRIFLVVDIDQEKVIQREGIHFKNK